MKKKRKDNLYISISLIGLLILVGLTLVVWRYYVHFIEGREYGSLSDAAVYERHYVLIPENSGSILWEDIYHSAKQTAEKSGAYLELLGDWEAGNYTPLDYLKLAIAAKVDGIILKPDGSAAMQKAIYEAEENGIPVITVLNDDSKSYRMSYVGPNSYQMGTIYGNAIAECIDDSTKKIVVLQRNDISGKELIFRELKNVVQEKQPEDQAIQIEDKTIISRNAFDAEEAIRDILHEEAERPDILVCMNPTDSESAYHTMIDYNLVDKVKIIGFYQTDIQLEAISKNTMPVVVTIDTGQVGKACIDALEEYNDMGYVSSYYSAELDVINKDNVKNYIGERGQDEA